MVVTGDVKQAKTTPLAAETLGSKASGPEMQEEPAALDGLAKLFGVPGKMAGAPSVQSDTLPTTERLRRRRQKRLMAYLATFREKADGSSVVGVSPPCRSYKNLITLNDYDSHFAALEKAKSPDMLTQSIENLKPFKSALNELVTLSRGALLSLERALRAAAKQEESRKAGCKPNSKEAKQAANVGIKLLWDRACEQGTVVARIQWAENTGLTKLEEPVIFMSLMPELFEEGKQAVDSFAKKFARSELKDSDGRAERAVKGNVRTLLHKTIDTTFLPDSIVKQGLMHPEVGPCAWGTAANQETVYTERGRLPALRVQFIGTRSVILVDSQDLRQFMEDKSLTTITPDSMSNFLKTMSKTTIDEYMQKYKIRQCTIGPGECLATPFDVMICERVHNKDIVGLRASVWLKKDGAMMEAVKQWHVAVRKPNKILSTACEILAAEEAD